MNETTNAEVDWFNVCFTTSLTEDTIREFQNSINWRQVSIYQDISEEFILEFSDKVDWDWISRCQKLGEEFIVKHLDSLNAFLLLKNPRLHLSDNVKLLIELRIL